MKQRDHSICQATYIISLFCVFWSYSHIQYKQIILCKSAPSLTRKLGTTIYEFLQVATWLKFKHSEKAKKFSRYYDRHFIRCCGKVIWYYLGPRTTDTQWRHKSKISENLCRCGRQKMLRPYLKIWEWEWIFGRAVKAISSLGVRSPWP